MARRLLTITGIGPLGVFLLVHLVVNARALRGEEAFTSAAGALQRVPALWLVEVALVYLPLLAHAGIGLWLVVRRTPLSDRDPYPRGVSIAMRATGVVALAFVVMHLREVGPRALGLAPSPGIMLTILAADLSSTWHGVPWRGVAYLLGTGAVTFHFAAGLWGAFARSPRAALASTRRAAALAAAALGATLWLFFLDVVVLHATGARLFGSPASVPLSAEPCPAPSASAP